MHRLETAKFESPKSPLLVDPVPGGGISTGNGTDEA
jgi:hypothetical protein